MSSLIYMEITSDLEQLFSWALLCTNQTNKKIKKTPYRFFFLLALQF